MASPNPVYLEIIDFIARGTTPDAVVSYRLSGEERAELDHFLELEHILRMAKARVRQIIASGE